MASYAPVSSRLSLRLQIGTDSLGRPQLRTLSLSGVDPLANANATYAVAQTLGGLLSYPVHEIQKVDTDIVS